MSRVRDVAQQVVDALPEDADFDDLEEFLRERLDIEHGRDDFDEDRVKSFREILDTKSHPEILGPNWSEQAAESFRETAESWRSTSSVDFEKFESAVLEALHLLNETSDAGIILPEMGDSSIRELHVLVGRATYRIMYDLYEGEKRVLWFTDNRTCYRNVKGYPTKGEH